MMILFLGVPNIILLLFFRSSGVAPQPEQQSSPQLW